MVITEVALMSQASYTDGETVLGMVCGSIYNVNGYKPTAGTEDLNRYSGVYTTGQARGGLFSTAGEGQGLMRGFVCVTPGAGGSRGTIAVEI